MARTPRQAEDRMNRPEKLPHNAGPHLASRMTGIEPFHVMALIARAREMEGNPDGVPVDASTAYQLTANLVEKHWTPGTAAVLIATPSNPTGTLIAHDELERIHAVVRAHGGALIVDEIYHGLTYGQRDRSALEFTDDVFIINSFSKYFGMTGWRLGWMVVPEAFMPAVDKLAQNLFISSSELAQKAALAAFHPDTTAPLEPRRDAFRAQRDFLV